MKIHSENIFLSTFFFSFCGKTDKRGISNTKWISPEIKWYNSHGTCAFFFFGWIFWKGNFLPIFTISTISFEFVQKNEIFEKNRKKKRKKNQKLGGILFSLRGNRSHFLPKFQFVRWNLVLYLNFNFALWLRRPIKMLLCCSEIVFIFRGMRWISNQNR